MQAQPKILFLFLAFVVMLISPLAQSPEQISYQFVVQSNEGGVVSNQDVELKLSIVADSITGDAVYVETHKTVTNVNGLATLFIGTGTTTDVFSAIKWGSSSYFIRSEIDIDGSGDYNISTITQLLSVPYALHAKTAEAVMGNARVSPSGDLTGVTDVANINAAFLLHDIVILSPGNYYVGSTIDIARSGLSLVGLGHANSTVLNQVGDGTLIIKASSKREILIENVAFVGVSANDAYNTSFLANSTAIQLYKTANVIIRNCEFVGFRSAAVDILNYLGSKREQNHSIENNRFYRCWMGVAMWYNSEYGILSNNRFGLCRTAILNESGNWMISNNSICDCRAAIIITNKAGQVNYAAGGNGAHGAVVGNTMNHSGTAWASNANMIFNGQEFDPKGIWIYGNQIPHSFSGNTCWYTSLEVTDPTDEFYFHGGLINNATITADNAVIHFNGTDMQRSVVYETLNGGVIDMGN